MEAVVDLRYKERDFWSVGRFSDFDCHAELIVRKFLEGCRLFVDLTRRRPFDTLKEDVRLLILVLIGMVNVTLAIKDPTRDLCY